MADDPLDVETFADRHYADFAAAFCRGRLGLDAVTDEEALAEGRRAGLRLHRYKRRPAELPRVRRVLGMLHGLDPATLLDLGTGRGVFLWPLLDAFPLLPVVCVDERSDRVRDLDAVRRGGLERLEAVQADVRALPFTDRTFDVVTALEVLEHVEEVFDAATEAFRAAERALVVSVPSKEDDNPEHVHTFTHDGLEALLLDAGAARVSIDYVRGHAVALALR